MAIILQHIISAISFTVVAYALSIAIGGFLFASAMLKDIRHILRAINTDAKSIAKQRQVLQKICVFIQFYTDLKQLSSKRSNI